MFRCCSFFELLMMTCSLIYSHNIPGSASMTGVISVLKAIMFPLQEELWRVFSLKQHTFSPDGLP